jgi:hypothetical protein
MGADREPLDPGDRRRVGQLAARLVLDDDFDPAEAVATASELLAKGVDVDGVVVLACQPVDRAALNGREVEDLFRAALEDLGVEVPSREAAGWIMARWIARSMMDGGIPAGQGALRLWALWRDCQQAAELAEMLQLHDAWEEAVGSARAAVEAEILAFAPEVVAAADRNLHRG